MSSLTYKLTVLHNVFTEISLTSKQIAPLNLLCRFITNKLQNKSYRAKKNLETQCINWR